MRFPEDVPTLTTGDVTLRAHRLEDVDKIVEQCRDPLSIRWTTAPLDYTRDTAVDWLTNTIPSAWESGAERIMAIETTHSDGRRHFSGSVSLRDEGDRRAEIAFGAHPAVRGHGVMTVAVNRLLDYGFDECNLETVIWYANVGNLASRRVAWKTGFTFAGVLPRWLDHRGQHMDAWVGTLHRCDERAPRSRWYDLPVLDGPGIRLRPFEDKDVPRITEACRDERTRHWLSFLPDPYSDDDAREFVRRRIVHSADGQEMFWAVVDPTSDVLLGNVGLPHSDPNSSEIGYWVHPDARGRGLMRGAVSVLTRFCFASPDDGGLGARRLYIKAAADNAASQFVALANGFAEYGRERQAERLGDGSYSDLVLFDLLRST